MQVVSAAGAVDHSQLVQLAEKAFSGLPSSGLSSEEYIKQVRALTMTQPSVLHVRGMHQCAVKIWLFQNLLKRDGVAQNRVLARHTSKADEALLCTIRTRSTSKALMCA